MKLSTLRVGLMVLVLPCLFVAGCRTGEEQANEDALKARNAQFSEMNKQSPGAPSPPVDGAKKGELNPPKQSPAPDSSKGGKTSTYGW